MGQRNLFYGFYAFSASFNCMSRTGLDFCIDRPVEAVNFLDGVSVPLGTNCR
jgi:hypothetical protein